MLCGSRIFENCMCVRACTSILCTAHAYVLLYILVHAHVDHEMGWAWHHGKVAWHPTTAPHFGEYPDYAVLGGVILHNDRITATSNERFLGSLAFTIHDACMHMRLPRVHVSTTHNP